MSLFNALPTPVLFTTSDGEIITANDAAKQSIGFSVGMVRNVSIMDILLPQSRSIVNTLVKPKLEKHDMVSEVYLELAGRNGKIPVLAECKLATVDDIHGVLWVMMITLDRSKFENDMLIARKRSETTNLSLLKSGKFVKTVTDAVPGLIAYMDRDGYCLFANKTCEEWYGQPEGSMIGLHLREFMPPNIYEICKPYLEAVLTGAPQHFQRALVKPDGSLRHTLTDYIPDIGDNGEVIGAFIMATDISALKVVESDLKLAHRIFENTVEGIMVTDQDNVILSVNPAFTTITGFSAAEAIGATPRILKSGRYERDFSSGLWTEIQKNGRWVGETWNCHKDGNAFLARQTITAIEDSDGYQLRYLTVFNDITERWQKDEQVRHLAFHDPLTDLPNRALLMERLAQLLSASGGSGTVALLFLDLDGFKAINDAYGHETGDGVLQIVAQKLHHVKRITDTVGRLGGDEFILLVNNPSGLDEIANVAERIINVIGEPMQYRGNAMHLGVSIGISIFPQDAHGPSQLMKYADSAMYVAKSNGKNQYCFYEHSAQVLKPNIS